MTTEEIREYYDSSAVRDVREDLVCAVSLTGEPKVAIDCGCGAGSDIDFLRAKEFTVHAFDIEPESIKRCRHRFEGDSKVILSHDSFNSFQYPSASLVTADASLFFCPEQEFNQVWRKIVDSLIPGGIFSGSFLGPKDTTASPQYDREAFWPDTLIFTEDQLRPKFSGFEIVRWTEHDMSGQTAQGKPHQWHIFSVVARKTLR